MIGLNFANIEEAGMFGSAITSLLSGRQKRREGKLKLFFFGHWKYSPVLEF